MNTGIRALRGPRLSAWLHRHKSGFPSISQVFEKVKLIMRQMLFINDYMSEMHGCLSDPKRILAGNADAIRFFCFIIDDQEGGGAVISGNEQDIGVLQQLFF